MVLRVVNLRACAVAALLLLAAGCSPQRRIDPVRTHQYGGSAMTLGDAYDQLLANAVWSPEYIKPEKLIAVRGTLKRSTEALVVYYRQGVTPPSVSFFTVAGKRRASGEFPLYLRREVLLAEVIASPLPAAPAAVVLPVPSQIAPPPAPP